jgi:hypothetical protein
MIDQFDYAVRANKLFKPLGIVSEIIDRDGCLYLILDGTTLYDRTRMTWKEMIGKDFDEFTSTIVPSMFGPFPPEKISDTKMEFKIGTIFDILARDFSPKNE